MDNAAFCTPAILYVDDEEMARKYFVGSFGEKYKIFTAEDADSAIEILKDEDYQICILVTDYRMPGRSGGDLLRQAAREFPHLVRILVTAYGNREVLLETVNSGEIFRILEKPMNMDNARLVLRLACDLARERGARKQKLMAIDEALAFLAHELNTPLGAISNFARGVQSRVAGDGVSARQQALISEAALAIGDNARYCHSLLFSFVNSVKGSGAQVTPYAGATARQMISALLDTYPLSPVQRDAIYLDVQEDFPILALPNCVALVLSSILSNALRAVSEQPKPTIRFTVRQAGNPQICISDNGCGIAPDILQRLLIEPVTTHADDGGNGWGLIFCKRIMQSFRGDISVSATPDECTAFTLDFPAIKIPVPKE